MIQLYLTDGCPFCEKVLSAVRELGFVEGEDYTRVDAAPGTLGRVELLRLGGKAMVPFLVDGEISMYESDDIVRYLRNKTNL